MGNLSYQVVMYVDRQTCVKRNALSAQWQNNIMVHMNWRNCLFHFTEQINKGTYS